MIVTDETSTSQDVINLAKEIQNLVIKNYKIKPVAECQFIGFTKDPLESKNSAKILFFEF